MLTAELIPASLLEEYEIATSLTDLAHEESAIIVETAKAEAKAHLEEAYAQADKIRSNAEVDYEKALAKMIADADRKVRSEMMVTAMQDVAVIKENYANSEAWLQELVMSSVEAVVGAMPKGKAQVSAIQSGIRHFSSRWSLTLRAPSKTLPDLHKLIDKHPEVFAVIEGVQSDDLLPDGSIHLCGDGGGLEVGISARLNALRDTLADEAAQHG
jgi:flagellar biosynthesis/type III secretory pathway protein FliH